MMPLRTAIALVLLSGPAVAQSPPTSTVTGTQLIGAGKATPIRDIDNGRQSCDGAMQVQEWLTRLLGSGASNVQWAGGKCTLVATPSPLDAKSHPWCARAVITPRQPQGPKDRPVLEIFFETPTRGQPGRAYAFRAFMQTKSDGPEFMRSRQEFEAAWRERFPTTSGAPICKDD